MHDDGTHAAHHGPARPHTAHGTHGTHGTHGSRKRPPPPASSTSESVITALAHKDLRRSVAALRGMHDRYARASTVTASTVASSSSASSAEDAGGEPSGPAWRRGEELFGEPGGVQPKP